jgi:hypothetical protein
LRVLPGAVDQPAQQHLGHVDQHQADQDLVGVEAVAQQRHDGGPGHAAQHAGQQDQHTMPRPIQASGARPASPPSRRPGAEHELPFGADVPDVGAVAHRQAQRDQDQRRGLDRQLRQRVQALHRLDEEHLQAAQRVLAQQHEQHHADQHRERQRQQRRQPATSPSTAAGALQAEHAQASSRVTGDAGHSPLIHSPIVRCGLADRHAGRQPALRDDDSRSLISNSSSSSSLTTSSAQPASRSASSSPRICAAAPTSTPQVGWLTISSFGAGVDLAADDELLQVAARQAAWPPHPGRRP